MMENLVKIICVLLPTFAIWFFGFMGGFAYHKDRGITKMTKQCHALVIVNVLALIFLVLNF